VTDLSTQVSGLPLQLIEVRAQAAMLMQYLDPVLEVILYAIVTAAMLEV